MRARVPALVLVAVVVTLANPGIVQAAAQEAAFGRLPLSFELNRGQSAARVKYLSRGPGYTLFLGANSVVFSMTNAESRGGTAIEATFIGASRMSSLAGEVPLQSRANYLVGPATAWKRGIPEYQRVRYRALYPGVDLVYHGNAGKLEYDFHVHPGVDSKAIRLRIEGADQLRVAADGNLVLHTRFGDLIQQKPVAYQVIHRRRQPVEAAFRLHGHDVFLAVGAYDRSRELVIDPTLVFATYLGPKESGSAQAIAVDATGHLYVTGFTQSTQFPTRSGSYKTSFGGNLDAFVVKLTKAGDGRIYSTYIGGNDFDLASGIAVDAANDAYVTGQTTSTDFPGVFIGVSHDSSAQAFVVKLNDTGTGVIYAARFGGNDNEAATDNPLGTIGNAITVDRDGNAHVVGDTTSTILPVTSHAFQTTYQGGNQIEGSGDGFAAVLNSSGTAMLACTYLGSSSADEAFAVATDSSGSTYAGGITWGAFPTSPGVIQSTNPGLSAGFVVKLDTTGRRVWSTLLASSDQAQVRRLAVDSADNVFAAGSVSYPDLPTTTGAFRRTFTKGIFDGFVTKMNSTATALLYSTFIGGNKDENLYGLAIDSAGNAYVTGDTQSSDFPLTADAFQKTFQGGAIFPTDTFLSVINSTGTGLLYSTYYGGNNDDFSAGVALDPTNNIYIAGNTDSTNLPFRGGWQATSGPMYMAKFSALDASTMACSVPTSSPGIHTCSPARGAEVSSPVTITATLLWDGHSLTGSKIYVDGTNRFTGTAGQTNLMTSVNLASGTHRLTIRMWYSATGSYSASEYFKVK